MEERISFTSDGYLLEGLLHRSASPVGIVITHPHPLFSGDKDEIAPADAIGRALPAWQPRAHFEIIAGADHFYSGHLEALAERLQIHL